MKRIIIGAGRTVQEGWISTQEDELNLLSRADFERLFSQEKPAAFLAEHVWEHMTLEEGRIAAKNCYDFLADGGYIRAAVPDANFRNGWYQNMVKIGGNGDPNHPAYTHKIVYDWRTFASVFEEAGFDVTLLEYCDERGDFRYAYWNEADGKIGRSYRFDTRNTSEGLGMVSIILDARKPLVMKSARRMLYSYVMGVDDSVLSLTAEGFDVRSDGGNWMVAFPSEKAGVWENFISERLEEGYFNDYISEDGAVLLFQLPEGIKRCEAPGFENEEALALCEQLCGCRFESLYAMLKGNHFYRERMK